MNLEKENLSVLAALSLLPEIEDRIQFLRRTRAQYESAVLYPEPVPGKPDEFILRLRPEFDEVKVREIDAEWLTEISALKARRDELLRVLNPQNQREVSNVT